MSSSDPAILIVDDIEENRYTLARRLKREGYENLQFAANGQQAIERLRAAPFDLVLLDIMMPVMNGYETRWRRMKSDMALRDIPVIMISAVDEIESVVRCIEARGRRPSAQTLQCGACSGRASRRQPGKETPEGSAGFTTCRQIEVEKKPHRRACCTPPCRTPRSTS